MKSPFSPRPEAGLSLIEMLIAFGVLTVVGMGVSEMIINSKKAQNQVSADVELTNLGGRLALLLADTNHCKNILGATATISPIAQQSVAITPNLGTNLPTGITVESVTLQNQLPTTPTTSTTTWPAQITIKFKKDMKNLVGSPTSVRSVPLSVTTSAWTPSAGNAPIPITACAGAAGTIAQRKQVCSDVGGTWDATQTPPCTGVSQSSGPQYSCSCPEGGPVGTSQAYCGTTSWNTHCKNKGGKPPGPWFPSLTSSTDLTGECCYEYSCYQSPYWKTWGYPVYWSCTKIQ